jgi:hypothetical protein
MLVWSRLFSVHIDNHASSDPSSSRSSSRSGERAVAVRDPAAATAAAGNFRAALGAAGPRRVWGRSGRRPAAGGEP